MIKLYKNKNPHVKKLMLLFFGQIALGVLPAVLFAIFVVYVKKLETIDEYNLSVGLIFIAIMLFALAAYSIASQKYNILVSGYRGERFLVKIAKKLQGNYTVFTNLPIRYKKNRSEIDLLIVGENKVLIIEAKNHSGVIIGSDSAETWIHRKYYRKGKITESQMENPFKQIRRQREILKSILRSNEIDVWVDSILFFSGNPGLRLKVNNEIDVAVSENELVGLIDAYEAKNPPSDESCAEIVRIIRGR